jgi:hypothetical protein
LAVTSCSALRQNDPREVLEFERGFGKIALGALALQVVTGVWLAHQWLGGWSHLFDPSNPASHLVLVKLGLLVATLALAGHAYHRVLPRLTPGTMRRFVVHAWMTTILAVLMLVAGASIRMGGPL